MSDSKKSKFLLIKLKIGSNNEVFIGNNEDWKFASKKQSDSCFLSYNTAYIRQQFMGIVPLIKGVLGNITSAT
jgi:hypothetical protein